MMNLVIGLGLGLIVGAVGMLFIARKVHEEIVIETVDECKKAYQEIIDESLENCERAINAGNILKEKLKEQDLALLQLVIEKTELQCQLEDAELLLFGYEPMNSNVINLNDYRNR